MDQKQAFRFLKAISEASSVTTRADWVIGKCPMAPWDHSGGKDNSPSFGVKVEAGQSYVNCFSCGCKGTPSDILIELRYRLQKRPELKDRYDLEQAMYVIQEIADELPNFQGISTYDEDLFSNPKDMLEYPEWWLDTFPQAISNKKAMAYLKSRGVSETLAGALDLRVDTSDKRLCFPVRDFDGVLRGLHGRDMTDQNKLRYMMYPFAKQTNPLVWLGESWVDFEKPIIVVEGPFDVSSVQRVYRNVVSPLFANPSKAKLARMAPAMEWVTFLDKGKAGDLGRERIHKSLTDKHTVVDAIPPVKDPGAMTEDELRELLDPILDLDPNPFDTGTPVG